MDDYFLQLRETIQKRLGCDSSHERTVPVRIRLDARATWFGQVEVMALIGCPFARRCFAWDFLREPGDWHFMTVLELPPIVTPHAAVRAALLHRTTARVFPGTKTLAGAPCELAPN